MLKRLFLLCFFVSLVFATPLFAQQWGDYTLYSVSNTNSTYLLDTNGTVVKTWSFVNAPTGYSSYLLPGGTLVRTVRYTPNSFMGGGQSGRIQKVDYNGTILWDYVYSNAQYSMHHDICPMPNGNVLLIAYELKTPSEVTAAGSTVAITMWPDKIVEVQPTGLNTGNVVWEWHAWDHLVQDVDSTKANYHPSVEDHPELLNINYNTQKDWLHANGIDYNPMLDQIVLSSHNMNEFYVIDHSTTTAEAAGHTGGNSGKGGDILYRWGDPGVYGAAGAQIFNVVHDAHWIPEGVPNAGRLVAFNNRGISNFQSAVDQIVPPVNGYNYDYTPGTAYMPATYDERHPCNGYTSNMGNSQQLPNGNMLVCMATSGNIYEIDANGTLLWSKTATGPVAQAFRYDTCYVNNPAPAIPVITDNGTDLESTAAVTYQWYHNGVLIAGATNQTFTPAQNGIYVVRITDANGCVYMYSSGYKYTGITALNQVERNLIRVYPNPTNGIIDVVNQNNSAVSSDIEICDGTGRLVGTFRDAARIDLSSFNNGLYFISITNGSGSRSIFKVSLIK